MQPPLPNFLVIGAQRCGTTWLYRTLRQHHDVFLPDKKELEFFSYRSGPNAISLEDYRRHFGGVDGQRRVGEVTPSYLWTADAPDGWDVKPQGFEPRIPERVRETLGPDVDLVVSLRDPVDRAISAFLMAVRMGRLSVDESILGRGQHGGIVALGFYSLQLRRWYEVFDPERFLILAFDELSTEPSATYRRLCGFLGIADDSPPEHLAAPANRNPGIEVDPTGALVLADDATTVDGTPLGGRVLVSADEHAALRELYAPDVRRLRELVPLDTSGWLTER